MVRYMKKKCFIIIVIVLSIFFILYKFISFGNEEKEYYSYTCYMNTETSNHNIAKELIELSFEEDNICIKQVYATLDKESFDEETTNSIIGSLESNYCNSEVKNDYSCYVVDNDEYVILIESGRINDVLGIEKKLSMKKIFSLLLKKGYKCKRKENS